MLLRPTTCCLGEEVKVAEESVTLVLRMRYDRYGVGVAGLFSRGHHGCDMGHGGTAPRHDENNKLLLTLTTGLSNIL